VRPDPVDRWLGPCLILLAVAWLWLAYLYIPGARAPGEPGPRAFPLLLGWVLLGLGTLMSVAAFRARPNALAEGDIDKPTCREVRFVFATFALLVAYAFLLERAGFNVATPLAILVLLRAMLKVRSWRLNLLMAGGVTLACWIIFAVLLEAPLPRGSWRWLL
jgi:putative tricarboxylic transport membrane protein